MKLRAGALALLVILPATILLGLSPAAAAAQVGDTLVNGSVAVVPGNPCNVFGTGGGIAVKEAGTSSVLYYSTRESRNISKSGAYMPTATPPACQGTIIPAVSGTAGWDALAYDAYYTGGRLWAARADDSGTIVGMTLTGAVVATISVPGATRITGLAVDEAAPHHLFVATGAASVLAYTTTGTPTLAANVPYAQGVSHLAAWSGALLTADGGDWIRNHKVDGAWLGMQFHPGDSYIDPWFQIARYFHYFDDMAFDEQTYAGQGALWTIRTEGGNFCIAQCPVWECTLYEGQTCIEAHCVQWCAPGDPIYELRLWPHIRAFAVKRTCPGGANVPPTQECQCLAPVPQPVFTSPADAVILRGVATSASAMPIVVQGAATVTAEGASPDHVITLRGPLPGATTVVGYGSASAAPLVASATPRGAYTYEASLFDAATGCRGGTATLTVWVEDPTSWTRAQALRVAGNIPMNVIADSIRAEPLDDLAGHEDASVVDRIASGSLTYDVAVLEASAAHGPIPGFETQLAADARAVADRVDLRVDLAGLCFDLTGDPACAPLPTVYVHEQTMRAEAYASLALVTAQGSSGSYVSNAVDGRVSETLRGSTLAPSLSACPTGACVHTVGGFRASFADTWQRVDDLSVEAYAAALRIEVTEGAYRGEIVVSEAYAGISLGGHDLLDGPTRFVELPDDYGTGADAPAAAGPLLTPGLLAGGFAGTDRADAFGVWTDVGQKLRVVIDPAHRLAAHLAPLPTAPATLAAPRLLEVTLYAPDGTLRDRSTLNVLDAHPALVELNVDIQGVWSVVVTREDTRDEAAPYSVLIDQRNVDLLAGDEADACAGALPFPMGGVAASMGATDVADTFAITVAAGQAVTAALAMADAEGADLDLRLLDAGCALVWESAGGKDPNPKGTPELLAAKPMPAGTAYVQVVRANGIGNYVLQAAAHKAV